MTTELDELVRALDRAEMKLSAYVGICKDDKELNNTVLPMVRKALAPFTKPKLVYVMPEWETLASYPGVSSREILHAGSQLWISEDVYNAIREATRVEEK